MIFWKIYRLIKGMCPQTRGLIIDALMAIRDGKKTTAQLRAKEAAEKEMLFRQGRKFLDG